MPEPITIVTSCVSILSGITSVSKSLATFIGATKGAKEDAQGFHDELQSLYATVALLQVTELRLPEHLEKRLSGVLQQCKDTIQGLKHTVDKHTTGKSVRNLQWALVNGDGMRQLRERLGMHVAVIEITLGLANAVKVDSIKDDTTAIQNELRARFVQDTLTYTESVVDYAEQQMSPGYDSDVPTRQVESPETSHPPTSGLIKEAGLTAEIATPVEASTNIAGLSDTARSPSGWLQHSGPVSQEAHVSSSSRRKSCGVTPISSAGPAETRSTVECITCHDNIPGSQAAKLECGHDICTACLKHVFQLSVTDASYMPPKCCTQKHIPLKHAAPLFNNEFKILWNQKYHEAYPKDRQDCLARPSEPVPTVKCSTCYSNVPEDQAAKLECGHIICTICLKHVFELSITHSSEMPPKCCTQTPIPLKYAVPLFDSKFKILWNKKRQEYSTKDPMYCPRKGCGKWIPPADQKFDKSVARRYSICGNCNTKTCKKCNSKWHGSEDCQNHRKVFLHSQPAPAPWYTSFARVLFLQRY